jgi:APA family basic amino acid/polyamine antiporter
LQLLDRNVNWQLGLKEAVAVAVIIAFGGMNCIGVRFGGRMQVVLSIAKVTGILGIAVGAFLFSGNSAPANAILSAPGQSGGLQGFGAAMLAALWAYDGWAYMPMVAGEVKHPARNVPRALVTGTVSVLVLYCLVNVAYFWALPFSDVVQSHSTAHPAALPVAARAAQSFLGARGPRIASLLFMLSAAGALNGVIMSTARIPYAMARDRLFFPPMGRLNAANVPAVVVFWLTLWSALLAVSGSFDRLTDMAVFGMWIFYALTASAVFVLRRKMPDLPRPYRAFGYPVMPALFVLVAIWLLCNSLVTSRIESITGLVLILSGWPFYRWFRRAKIAADVAAEAIATGTP